MHTLLQGTLQFVPCVTGLEIRFSKCSKVFVFNGMLRFCSGPLASPDLSLAGAPCSPASEVFFSFVYSLGQGGLLPHGRPQARPGGAAVQTVELVLGSGASFTRLCLIKCIFSALSKRQSSAHTAELNQQDAPLFSAALLSLCFPMNICWKTSCVSHLNIHLSMSMLLVCRAYILTVPSPLGVFFFTYFSFLAFREPRLF